jgi:hypothetical protein
MAVKSESEPRRWSSEPGDSTGRVAGMHDTILVLHSTDDFADYHLGTIGSRVDLQTSQLGASGEGER